jgi:penicillin-insensitive murein DD-endopeptidase
MAYRIACGLVALALLAGPATAESPGGRNAAANPHGLEIAAADEVPLPEKRPPPERTPSSPAKSDLTAEFKKIPAKDLFASVSTPAAMPPQAIGFYTKGCMAGGEQLPITGPDWQVMRLSRNRNWGLPVLVHFLERFASDAHGKDGWPGLLIGDMAQPRGGPMINGHSSHQVGLDADVWFRPMPDHVLSREERDTMMSVSLLKDPLTIDPKVWSPLYVKLLKRVVSYPQVQRIFVNPVIKQKLCEAAGADKSWLAKVRPWWGHYSHFHIRLACPPGMTECKSQPPVSGDDGCGKELTNWLAMIKRSAIADAKAHRAPETLAPGRSTMLSALPRECRTVLSFGKGPPADPLNAEPVKQSLASNDASPPMPLLSDAELKALTAKKGKSVPLPPRKPR